MNNEKFEGARGEQKGNNEEKSSKLREVCMQTKENPVPIV
jgi:hypothetical protein